MPRFYFHICAKDVFIRDPAGAEMLDLKTAHWHALKIIYDSMFYVSEEPIWKGWMVKIADEREQSLLTVLYHNRLWTDRKAAWKMLRAQNDNNQAANRPFAPQSVGHLSNFTNCRIRSRAQE